jgi:hypothetical protein
MSYPLKELTVRLHIIWWFQTLGRERLLAIKQAVQNFDMERLNLRKLNHVEVKEQFLIKISNRFSAYENLDENVDITFIVWILFHICMSRHCSVLSSGGHAGCYMGGLSKLCHKCVTYGKG